MLGMPADVDRRRIVNGKADDDLMVDQKGRRPTAEAEKRHEWHGEFARAATDVAATWDGLAYSRRIG